MKTAHKPWYRIPFVWLLFIPPLAAVLAGVSTFYLAATSFDGMVADDYYQRGKAINQVLHRDQAAARYGVRAQLHIDEAKDQAQVRLTAAHLPRPPEALTLRLFHATRASADIVLPLTRAADGEYYGALPPLQTGRWDVVLEGDDWRLTGSLQAPRPGDLRLGFNG